MGFEPTTPVIESDVLTTELLETSGEQGSIYGSRLEPHHVATQPSNDCTHELTNNITLSH